MYPEFDVKEGDFLAFLCFDDYVVDGLHCVHGCQQVDVFVLERPVAVNAPRTGNRGDIDDDIELPGETVQHLVATEGGKKIARTLFEDLWCTVQIGKYFQSIQREHVYVGPDGCVRLKGVQVVSTENILEWQRLVRENYRAAVGILRAIFNAAGGIPPELQDLFTMIDADEGFANIDLYHIHASLIPIGVGCLVFQKMFDHVNTTIDDQKRAAILLSLQPFLHNWRTLASGNPLLSATYNHQQGGMYAITDARLARWLGIPVATYQAMSQADKAQHELLYDCEMFFLYLRNRIAHRMEAQKAGSDYRLQNGQEYSVTGADYLFIINFGLVICHVQKQLSDVGELKALKLSHFTSGLYPNLAAPHFVVISLVVAIQLSSVNT